MTGDRATERRSGQDGQTATAEELLLIGLVTLWVQIAAVSEREKGKYVFVFQFRPHTGFLLDDR